MTQQIKHPSSVSSNLALRERKADLPEEALVVLLISGCDVLNSGEQIENHSQTLLLPVAESGRQHLHIFGEERELCKRIVFALGCHLHQPYHLQLAMALHQGF